MFRLLSLDFRLYMMLFGAAEKVWISFGARELKVAVESACV